jgi:glutathione S-transferase
MSVEYVSVAEAIRRPGLRMVVVGNVPSPWGEAAKGIFHLKRIPFVAVRLVYDDEALKQWAGQLSGPVAIYDDEVPRSGWAEILMLAERLAPQPALLPLEPHARARALQLADQLVGQGGLAWTRRLQKVHDAQKGTGFAPRVAAYLGRKYGYDASQADRYGPRVRELLRSLAAALREQRAAGKPYYLGDELSAADVYSATTMAVLKPLPEALCSMDAGIRAAFEQVDEETAAALDPVLIEHRDLIYERHLELPLSL